jgi:hypothetical protein
MQFRYSFAPEIKHADFMQRYGILILVMVCSFIAKAQITANDSVTLGANYTSQVFYSLSTGQKTITSNTDWHIAVSVRATQFPSSPLGGTTIRVNEANGLTVYYVPNAGVTSFNTLDTTGFHTWTKLHDSDIKMDEGALNSNRNLSNLFDFGWGSYNANTHNVTGDSLYLFELPNGEVKKFYVQDLVWDTAWIIKYSNIDNSNPVTLNIGKPQYAGKNFVYVNLSTGMVEDKEPASSAWDLWFTRYEASDVAQDTITPEVGVLVNKGRAVAEATQVNVNTVTYNGFTQSTDMNTIGWDWKYYDNGNFLVRDSVAYFVWDNYGQIYKIVFSGFNQTTGVAAFNLQQQGGLNAIAQVEENNFVKAVFPNPSNNVVNIAVELDNNAPVTITLTDLNGRQVLNTIAQAQQGKGMLTIPVSDIASGIYLLNISNQSANNVSRVVVAH